MSPRPHLDDDAGRSLRRAFSLFPSGVLGVGALVDGQPVGLAVTSFTSVSLDPPLVSICVAHTSTTWPRLSAAPRLGISVLGSEHEVLCRTLASREVSDRFADASWEATPSGAVFIDGAALWLECGPVQSMRGGDHDIILMEVFATQLFPEVTPLVFHQSRLRALQLQP